MINLFFLAALVLSVLSCGGVARAQNVGTDNNVRVYGVLDVGMEYLNNAGSKGGNLLRLHSGGMNTSRIGFKGEESLGDDMRTFFQLESGFMVDSGAMSDPHSFFNRQANVGIAGQYGSVLLGRSESTTGDFYNYDPLGNNYSWSGASTHLRGGRRDGILGRISNLLKYEGRFGAYRFGASYGMGETAGSAAANAKYALGAEYIGAIVSGAMTYDQENSNVVFPGYSKARNVHVSGAYAFATGKFYAGWRRHEKRSVTSKPDLRSDFVWVGASYRLSAAMTLSGALYHVDMRNDAKGNNANPTMYAARLKYALSPRTNLYLTGAYAQVKNSQPVGVSNAVNFYSDSGTQIGLNAGVVHRF